MQLQRAKLLIFTGLLFLISINVLHAQSASINGPTPSGTINVGDTRTFTLSVTGVQSIVNINWGSSSNYTVVSGQGTTSAQIKFLTVGSVLVNAQVTTLPSFQNFYPSKTVQVNGSVVGQVSITSGITSRCKGGGTSDYNASASNANSYSWSLSPSSAGTINSSTGLVSWNSSYPSSGTSIATVSVTAYGDNNSSSTASRSVTVQSQPSAPPPLSATDTSICSGESSTLSIAGSVLGLQYTLYRNGTSVGTQTSTQFGQQLSWTVSTGGSYYVISTDPNNSCGSSPAGNTVTITSQQGLGTNIVLNNEGSSTRCQGTGTTDFNVTGGSNSNTYQWSVTGSGNTISGSGRNATVNWSSGFGGTTATISAVITSQCGTSTTRTRTVTVDSAVSAPPPLSAADTSICSGEATTLTIAGSVLGLQYTLFRNGTSVGTQTSTQFGQQLSWTVSTAGNYHVTANDPGDTCGSGPAGNTVTLTTQQGLGTNIVLNNEGSSTRCQGTGTTDFNVTGGSNSNTYQWSVTGSGNTISGTGRNATVNWSSGFGGTTATISVLITSQCGTTTTPTRSVVVNPIASAPPPLSAADTSICSDETTTLTLAGSVLGLQYTLFRNGTSVGTQTSTQFGQQLSWTVSTAGNYYVTSNDPGNTCGSGPAGNTVTLTTQQGLGTNIALNNEGSSTRCQGTGTTDFNVTGGSNSNTYQWSVTGSGNTISGSGRNATVNWSASYGNSTATISVLITSECGATTTPTSSVFVNPLPSGPPPLSASSETFCSGGSTTLSLAGSAKDVSYALYRGTTLVGTQTSQEFGEQLTWTVSTAGDYYVIIPDQGNSCGSGPAGNTVNISQITPTTLQINTTPSDLSNICAGTPITLTVNGTNATWNGGERANSIVVTPIAGGPTTYTVTANEENCGQLQNASITITPQTPLMWYSDTDGDGLGDRFGSPVLSCSSPGSGWVSNNDDFCPDNSGLANNSGCPPGLLPENLNWITSKVYDIDGTLKASSKSYYNDLGKLEQTQTVEIDSNRTWASQVVFDSHGRAAVQSLSAPNGLPGTFQYQPDFMRNNTGQTYSLADFSNTAQDPGTVGQNLNTLGWYYSTANDDDFYPGNDYQDITEYPFSRTIYSTLNPGSVLKAVGGNKVDIDGDGTVDTWPQNYSFSMPATDELSLGVAFGDNAYQNILTTKTVSRDVHGNENVIFTDSEGKALAAARSGGTNISNYMNHFIGEQGYVDIHVPQGLSGVTSSNGSALRVFDMITETLYTGTLGALPSGFYRMAVIDPDNYTPGSISVGYRVNYYDYSLNEYDKADRLVKSYQPLGDTKASKPVTSYDYDALGQLKHTDSPDEGEAWFKYREDGQIRFSQNSKQRDPNEDGNFADAEFSYTEYDTFGRPIESGVLVSTGFDAADPDGTLPSGTKKEQQFTTYDIANDAALATALGSRSGDYPSQSFVAGNVAHTANDISETWYAYDVYGRVKWLVQNIQGLGAKTIDYTYHPTTGLVTEVIFQKNVSGEQFIHRYGYDIKDRLSTVETSSDGGGSFEMQAQYSYYEQGGLKRIDLANGAQGVDFVYSLAGQLKSINQLDLTVTNPGDNNDLFGMQLDYHNADYNRSVANMQAGTTYGTDQFNGNIKGVRWSNGYNIGTSEYVYSYDRNNWLTAADFNPSNQTGSLPELLPLSGNITGDQAAAGSITITPEATISGTVTLSIDPSGAGFSAGDYDVTNITYDANGNIQSLKRNKGSQDGNNAMDDLSYIYKTTPQDGPNQLLQVTDAEGDVAGADDDIGTQAANNYSYNQIGELTRNIAEDIDYFYNTSGLVTEVRQNGQPEVKFFYNDRNHRTKKETYSSGSLQYTTYYVRDIDGRIVAIYDNFEGSMALKEQPVYGSDRVGVAYANTSVGENRNYVYELTDHLGNVRVVFTKNGNSVQGESYSDYYPFGMQMPARGLLGPQGYRYAFQGQEKDNETGKEAFELRFWDARIGRWLTTDPYGEFASPYLGMGNNPIALTDPDGGMTEGCCDEPIELEGFTGTQYTNAKIGTSWQWLNKYDLFNFAKTNFGHGLNDGQIQNLVGRRFEDAWNRFATIRLMQFNYRSNSTPFHSPKRGRDVVPDGLGDFTHYEYRTFPWTPWPIPGTGRPTAKVIGGIVAEVKAMNGNIYTSTSSNQILGHLDVMSRNPLIKKYGGQFIIITTANVEISESVKTAARKIHRNFTLMHVKVKGRIKNGNLELQYHFNSNILKNKRYSAWDLGLYPHATF